MSPTPTPLQTSLLPNDSASLVSSLLETNFYDWRTPIERSSFEQAFSRTKDSLKVAQEKIEQKKRQISSLEKEIEFHEVVVKESKAKLSVLNDLTYIQNNKNLPLSLGNFNCLNLSGLNGLNTMSSPLDNLNSLKPKSDNLGIKTLTTEDIKNLTDSIKSSYITSPPPQASPWLKESHM
jgi:flagellar hook-basal body complex protein FliE